MAVEKVIWSSIALNQRRQILQYWIDRTGSNDYSFKILETIIKNVNAIKIQPYIGRKLQNKSIRLFPFSNFLLFYEVNDDVVNILLFRDQRQNPDDLEILLKD